MEDYIGNRDLSFKKIYQNRVNKDVVSRPNYWTCCQRMKKEKAAETCVLSCNLHSYNLICLRRWLRNSITRNVLGGLYLSAQIMDQLGYPFWAKNKTPHTKLTIIYLGYCLGSNTKTLLGV